MSKCENVNCVHKDKDNNTEIGYEYCSGEYCDYKFVPIREV